MLVDEDLRILMAIEKRLGINLNEDQRKLILTRENKVLCNATPGSGKTLSLMLGVISTELIQRIPGSKIVVMTFTDKAKREFETRHKDTMRRIGKEALIKVRTINALCKQYVSLFYNKIGLIQYELLDDKESVSLMKKVLEVALSRPAHTIPNKTVVGCLSLISFINNRMIVKQEEIIKQQLFLDLGLDYNQFERIRELYRSSQYNSGRLDHDETMVAFNRILEEDDNVRNLIQKEINALFVDEFQDTSELQFDIIQKLKSKEARIIAVGDRDQSIYRWRGASDVYDTFTKVYPDYIHVALSINYRCPDKVIQAANFLIRNNKKRFPVVGQGTGKTGRILVYPLRNNKECADKIVEDIHSEYERHNRDNFRLINKLILYRNHRQASFLVYEFAKRRVPVVTSPETLIHRDKMVSDLLEICDWLRNPRDSNKTSKNIWKVCEDLRKPKDETKCPFFLSPPDQHFAEVPVTIRNENKYKTELQSLVNISKAIRDSKPVVEIFEALIPMYLKAYYDYVSRMQGKTPEEVMEMYTFLVTAFDPKYDLDQFQHLLALTEKYVRDSSKEGVGVKIFTVHSAKGLEAEKVYLLDVNGGIQPNSKIIKSFQENKAYKELQDYVEEERSLFFVAITRTLQDLVVTYIDSNPSPFNYESGLNKEVKVIRDAVKYEIPKEIMEAEQPRIKESIFGVKSLIHEDSLTELLNKAVSATDSIN